jgi:hypothetical protein
MKIIFNIFLLSLLPIISVAQNKYEATQLLNLRDSSSTKAKIISSIPKGGVVDVIEPNDNGWWLVNYDGYEGYVSAKYLVISYSSGDKPDCNNINEEYNITIDNYLRINVGNNTDVIVKLMRYNSYMETCIRVVYIKAGETYEIKNIPEGEYYLKIAYGKELRRFTIDDQCYLRFEKNALYEKGKDILNFVKVKTPNKFINGKEYENWSIPSFALTLNVIYSDSKGNAFKSSNISEVEFNK